MIDDLNQRVTVGPKGSELREFFMRRLDHTMSLAAQSGDHVLIIIFAHGDFDSNSGLLIGTDPIDIQADQLMTLNDVATILQTVSDCHCVPLYEPMPSRTLDFNTSVKS